MLKRCLSIATASFLTVAFGIALPSSADLPVQAKPAQRLDQYGDPLPEHTVLRIGTVRLRPAGTVTAMAFTPDGKRLTTINGSSAGHVWDTATGKEVAAFGHVTWIGLSFEDCAWPSPAHHRRAVFLSYPSFPGLFQFGDQYAVSADGSLAAFVEPFDICRIYDTATRQELRALHAPWGDAIALCLSPDNAYLGSLHQNGVVRVWKIATGALVQRWQNDLVPPQKRGMSTAVPMDSLMSERAPSKLVFSPDAKTLAIGTPGNPLSLWDVATGKRLHEYGAAPKTRWNFDMAFSPNGSVLATSELITDGDRNRHQNITLWESSTGQQLSMIAAGKRHLSCVRFAPDGKSIATGDDGGDVCIWDVATGMLQRILAGHQDQVASLAFSPDGKRLATGSVDCTARIWDFAKNQQLLNFEGPRLPHIKARFSADGKAIHSSCADSRELHAGHRRPALFHPSSEGATLRCWDAATGKAINHVKWDHEKYNAFCCSNDGRLLVVSDPTGILRLHNLATEKEGSELERAKTSFYRAFEFSGDCRYLVADGYATTHDADWHSTSAIWDITTGKQLVAYSGQTHEQNLCRFSSDSRYLATLYVRDKLQDLKGEKPEKDKTRYALVYWDLHAGRKALRVGPTPHLEELGSFSPSGRLTAAFTSYPKLAFKELATGQTIWEWSAAGERAMCHAMSPDGQTVAVGMREGSIALVDFSTRKQLAHLTGHRSSVYSLDFSPDGTRLVSGSDDTTILVWEVSAWADTSKRPPIPLLPGVAIALWNDLASDDAAKTYAAVGQLLQSPKETVALLRQQLPKVQPAQPKDVAQMIADLDSARYADREQAMAKLLKLGWHAVLPLEKVLDGKPPLEVRQRVEMLLSKVENQPMPRELLQTWRALDVLEMLGTPEAVTLLHALSGGEPDIWLTQEAGMSLQRVGKRHGV